MSPMTGRAKVTENLKTVLVCVDSYEDTCMTGMLYHSSLDEGKSFGDLMQMILMIEKIIEDTGFPKPTTEKRSFVVQDVSGKAPNIASEEKQAIEAEHDFESIKGEVGTFKIKVMFRQHASWQGSVSWLEGDKTETFRSALELILLIDSAIHPKQS